MDSDQTCESIHTPHENSSENDIPNYGIAYPNPACLYCKKPFEPSPTRFSVARRFCSNSCQLKARSFRRAKGTHYLTIITCEICGKKFPPVSHNGHTPLTCSPECSALKKQARKKRYRDKERQEWAEKRQKRLEFEASVVAAFKEGKMGPQVAGQFSISVGAANKIKQKYGLHTNARLTAKQDKAYASADLVMDLMRSGITLKDCAQQTGLTRYAIRRLCKMNDFKIKRVKPPKDPGGSPNFPPERNAALRALWPSEKSTEEVFAFLNSLPGPQLTLRQYYSRAEKCGVQRPVIRKEPERKSDSLKVENPKSDNWSVVQFSPNPTMRRPPSVSRRKAVSIDHIAPDPPSDGWSPGGAPIPVSRLWSDIQMLAANDGWELRSFIDIVPYNKSRIRQNKNPYAISDVRARHVFKMAR